MQFPPSFLDEIRNRLLPSAVIGKKVALKAHGREHTGLCPFHKEKTSSFTVSDEKGFYHCFGCNAHGDIVKFVMETEGLPFVEAVKKLAFDAGVALPEVSPEAIRREKKAQSLYEIMEMASCFFENQLNEPCAKTANENIEKRGLKDISIKKFRMGYAPDSKNSLKNFLQSKNVTDKQMLDVGLLTKNDRGDIYDKFRGRIMFPIIDVRGRVIAFGGRILGEGQPKYLNSPETVLFHKGDVLYNENNARKLAFKTGKIVVTEGYMDVIAMDAVGIRTAVAPLGTAVTESHLRRLWHMAREPVICLDGDAAGQRAMDRTANLCLPLLQPGYTLKFTTLEGGMDPDDFIKKLGVAAMRSALQNAKPLSEVLWQIESTKHTNTTPEKKAELEKRLSLLAEKIKDQVVSKYYNDFFRNKLWSFNRPNKEQNKFSGKLTQIGHMTDFNINSLNGCEAVLVLLAIRYPEILLDHTVHDEFINIEFSSDKLDKIRVAILEVCDLESEIDEKNLKKHLENSGFSNDILYLGNLLKEDIGPSKALPGWKYNIALHNILSLKSECSLIEEEMTEQSEKIVSELRKQISELQSKLKSMEIAFGE